MKSLPVDYASLVVVWCSTVLYGVKWVLQKNSSPTILIPLSLVLYFSCVNLLIRRRWWYISLPKDVFSNKYHTHPSPLVGSYSGVRLSSLLFQQYT
ncbi:hypothetical protein EDD18DRAFT_529262 [Armillaria luteobubalina]|uniref:Uncharacterized protein n=1 Tax=Armillaria luteobubalina TaxID=153913 RepID=A0AA39PZA9_9AGAR|nr:hypothetical protein EDD18DRAFT_529262 [Armillaria luteobubalina]